VCPQCAIHNFHDTDEIKSLLKYAIYRPDMWANKRETTSTLMGTVRSVKQGHFVDNFRIVSMISSPTRDCA